VINPSIYKKLPFDTERDFAPISMVASTPILVAVNPGVPAKSLKELVDLAHADPKAVANYGSAGNGTVFHLATELFKRKYDIDPTHIPYRGGGPAVAATMGGDVPLLIVSIPAAMSQVRSGRLRPLAVSTKKRTPILPDVPTVAEAAGLKGYEVDSWYAVFAPAKAPDEVVTVMQKAITAAAAQPEVKAKLLEQGAVAVSSSPEELGKMVHHEIDEWRAVVKRANIEGE
jgi:tripartite-type tricarboxylate transporter receptor subunit TctC